MVVKYCAAGLLKTLCWQRMQCMIFYQADNSAERINFSATLESCLLWPSVRKIITLHIEEMEEIAGVLRYLVAVQMVE